MKFVHQTRIHLSDGPQRLPEGITLEAMRDRVVVSRSWWCFAHVFPAVVAAAACFAPYLKGDQEMLWLGISGATVALLIIVVTRIERTILTVTPDQLTLKHRPLPWYGSRRINTERIVQLVSERHARFNRDGFERSPVFELKAVLDDGSKVHLLGSIRVEDTVLLIEECIEGLLGIDDRTINGTASVLHQFLRFVPMIVALGVCAWVYFRYVQ